MPLILPGNVASATAGAYEIANSLRFNSGDSAKLQITSLGTPSDAKKWTWSGWVKMAKMSGDRGIMRMLASVNDYTALNFNGNGQLEFDNKVSGSFGGRRMTSAYYRDPAAWMHIVAVFDSDNATGDDRMILYVNGSRITAFGTDTDPSSGEASGLASGNTTTLGLSGTYYNGCYLAEVVFCDGQAYAASDFGEFDSVSPTIWKPKDVSGLTFGDEGYWLDFENSGDLGNDVSGNNNDFDTVTNLAAADQAVDTPTNNFCVINPLDNEYAEATLTEGNCNTAMSASKYNYITSTFGLSKGKWYFEAKLTAAGGTAATVGIAAEPATSTTDYLGGDAAGASILYQISGSGNKSILHGTEATYGSTSIAVNSVLGIYIDLDNNKAYGSVNGTLQSATGLNITAPASTSTGFYFPAFGDYDGADAYTFAVNFGGCPAFAISSGNTDDNGYGNFEYSPNITGDSEAKKFYAICSKNLGEFGG
jgi:hypothetical protein